MNTQLRELDKIFNPDNFHHCVARSMLLIHNREQQMTSEGYEWPIVTSTCEWAIEQAIINRDPNSPMMAAAIEYVESVERRAELFNNID